MDKVKEVMGIEEVMEMFDIGVEVEEGDIEEINFIGNIFEKFLLFR